MSTRSSIKYEMDDGGKGFHLFTDFLDERTGSKVVHLELRGVEFEADSSGAVHVVLPQEWAEKLGLVPPNTRNQAPEARKG